MSDDLPRTEEEVKKPDPRDLQLHAVTSIIKAVGGNEGLIYWAAEETAKKAARIAHLLPQLIEANGLEATVKDLRDARFDKKKGERTAIELGTAFHAAAERYVIDGARPDVDDELEPFLVAFDRWCQAFQPKYEAAEMTVYSPTFGYAGTLDAILRVGDARVVTDYKVTKKVHDAQGKLRRPYPAVALQLAAYRHAELAAVWRPRRYEQMRRRFYLLGPDEQDLAQPIPDVDGGLVLHVTPESCIAYPVRCDDVVHRYFLYAIEAYRWTTVMEPEVLGQPLEPSPAVAHVAQGVA